MKIIITFSMWGCFFLSLFCSAHSQDIVNVPIHRLIANPQDYDGKIVRTVGFIGIQKNEYRTFVFLYPSACWVDIKWYDHGIEFKQEQGIRVDEVFANIHHGSLIELEAEYTYCNPDNFIGASPYGFFSRIISIKVHADNED